MGMFIREVLNRNWFAHATSWSAFRVANVASCVNLLIAWQMETLDGADPNFLNGSEPPTGHVLREHQSVVFYRFLIDGATHWPRDDQVRMQLPMKGASWSTDWPISCRDDFWVFLSATSVSWKVVARRFFVHDVREHEQSRRAARCIFFAVFLTEKHQLRSYKCWSCRFWRYAPKVWVSEFSWVKLCRDASSPLPTQCSLFFRNPVAQAWDKACYNSFGFD